jgi:hypothetical protein
MPSAWANVAFLHHRIMMAAIFVSSLVTVCGGEEAT